MQYHSDFAPSREETFYQYQTFADVNVNAYTPMEPQWSTTIDPALRPMSNDYNFPPKMMSSSHEMLQYYPSPVSTATFATYPFDDAVSMCNQTDWPPAFENSRQMRYHSPGGPYGGTLSESSGSDYPVSPGHGRSTVLFSNSPVDQPSFQFASPAMEGQMSQQTTWSNFVPLHTPPSESNLHPRAIAMREIEGHGVSDSRFEQHDQHIHGTPMHSLPPPLPINNPVELELSENIASLTTSSRSTEHDLSEHEWSMKDHDSDSDFNPSQHSHVRTTSGVSNHARSTFQARSPRRLSNNIHPTLDTKSRIQKTARQTRGPSSNKDKSRFKSMTSCKKQAASSPPSTGDKPPRSFPCTFHAFGCGSKFANKNEWKRHVSSQHLQLGYFRCDLGQCNPQNNPRLISSSTTDRPRRRQSHEAMLDVREEEEQEITYNDFNRKDLFTQHCRRMHGPLRHALDDTTETNQRINERARRQLQQNSNNKSKVKVSVTKEDEAAFEIELETIRDRCWTIRRQAPERSSCGFCGRLFQADQNDGDGKAGERAWEERMEHIGKHYERDGCSSSLESIDDDLRDWGLQTGVLHLILESEGGQPRAWLVGYDVPTPAAATTPVKHEEVDDVSGREVQRRKGLRRRLASTASRFSPPLKRERETQSSDVRWRAPTVKHESLDSDTDADAEDE